MGQCTSRTKQRPKSLLPTQFTPQQLESFLNLNLPQLSYDAAISNIKIKKCLYKNVSIKIEFEGEQSFFCDEKHTDEDGTAKVHISNTKWKEKKGLSFKATQKQLREKRLVLKVMSQGLVKGEFKISLYMVATGPYHHDFLVKAIDKKDFRVSFDLKISQIIDVRAEVKHAKISLDRQYPGDTFTFYLKTIIGNSTWTSDPSYTIRIGLEEELKKAARNDSRSPRSPTKKRRDSFSDFQKVVAKGENIEWKKSDCSDMPEFDAKFPCEEFPSASIELTFWSLDSPMKTEVGIEQITIDKVIASCCFSFNKLIQGKSNSCIQKDGINFQNYEISLQQDLKQSGQTIGKSLVVISICVQEHIRQMHVCVNTQYGILKSSPVFNHQQQTSGQIAQLSHNNEQIKNTFVTWNNLKGKGSTSRGLQEKQLINKILKKLQQQHKLLLVTFKQSMPFYKYSNEKDLMRGQKQLLQVGFQLINYVKQENGDIRNQCWPIIKTLMKRGQFYLYHIGFKSQQIQQIAKNQLSSFIKKRIEVGVRYQQFILELLEIALNSLNTKGFQEEKSFAEAFIAFAYFRIPSFRNELLETITHPQDPEIGQWRGTQFSLSKQQNVEINLNDNTFRLLFDWGNFFHKCLSSNQKVHENQTKLIEILGNKDWKFRLAKRDGAFFAAVSNWVQYVQYVTVTVKDIKWYYFPGYNKIMMAFLAEMKLRPIHQYSTKMKLACCKLLSNQKLLNIFITIIFNKANTYYAGQVLRTLQMLRMFLEALNVKGKLIPSNLNAMFLYRGFKTIIEGQFAFAIAKLLQILYNYFHMFSVEFQIDISMYLLGKVFFKLFLHWSNNVRVIFYHLLNYRIYYEANRVDPKVKPSLLRLKFSSDIKQRYEKLMSLLNDIEEQDREARRKDITMKYEKQFYKVMKKKIHRNKREISKGSIEEKSTQHRQTTTNLSNLKMRNLGSVNKNQLGIGNKEVLLTEITQNHSHPISESKYQRLKLKSEKSSSFSSSDNFMLLSAIEKQQKSNSLQNSPKSKLSVLASNGFAQIAETSVSYVEKSNKNSKKLSVRYLDDITIGEPSPLQKNLAFTAIDEYAESYKKFQEFVRDGRSSIPVVSIQMPIDQSQMRPQSIDQW